MTNMSSTTDGIGRCPECETDLTRFHILLEYENADGEDAIWADCPSCGTVVHPEPADDT
jgi:uncharacterized Zn finger protein